MNTSPSRYSTLTISLHWLMLLLMIAVYATIELRVMFPKGAPPREAIKALHFMLGLCVLLLVVPRLVARLFGTTPAIQPPHVRANDLCRQRGTPCPVRPDDWDAYFGLDGTECLGQANSIFWLESARADGRK